MQELAHGEALRVDQVPEAAVTGIPGVVQMEVAEKYIYWF